MDDQDCSMISKISHYHVQEWQEWLNGVIHWFTHSYHDQNLSGSLQASTEFLLRIEGFDVLSWKFLVVTIGREQILWTNNNTFRFFRHELLCYFGSAIVNRNGEALAFKVQCKVTSHHSKTYGEKNIQIKNVWILKSKVQTDVKEIVLTDNSNLRHPWSEVFPSVNEKICFLASQTFYTCVAKKKERLHNGLFLAFCHLRFALNAAFWRRRQTSTRYFYVL